MKTSFLKIATVALLATSASSGMAQVEKTKTAGENVEQVNTEVEQVKPLYKEEMKQFQLKSKEQIVENDKKIVALKESAKGKSEEAKVEFDKSVDALAQKNQALKVKIDGYKDSGKEQWELFKNEFSLELNELNQSLSKLDQSK